MSDYVNYFMQNHKSLGKLNNHLVDRKVRGLLKKILKKLLIMLVCHKEAKSNGLLKKNIKKLLIMLVCHKEAKSNNILRYWSVVNYLQMCV